MTSPRRFELWICRACGLGLVCDDEPANCGCWSGGEPTDYEHIVTQEVVGALPPAIQLRGRLDGEWRTAKQLAAVAGLPARGVGQRLRALEREGIAERRRVGSAPSPRSDPPPYQWRRRS